MRMVFTHGIADNTRRFTIGLIRGHTQFAHRIQNTPLYRLQSIAYIRQCPRHDNAHGIVDVAVPHGLFQINHLNLVDSIRVFTYNRLVVLIFIIHNILFSCCSDQASIFLA